VTTKMTSCETIFRTTASWVSDKVEEETGNEWVGLGVGVIAGLGACYAVEAVKNWLEQQTAKLRLQAELAAYQPRYFTPVYFHTGQVTIF
jgi:hypothetical protein